MMEKFARDLEIGEIHLRDKWQFEMKADFTLSPSQKENIYSQEFYLFIPNSLQINSETYVKNQFYHDQTNLIRLKTPEISFEDLLNTKNVISPFYQLLKLSEITLTPEEVGAVEEQLKLLGNVVRSTIRNDVGVLVHELDAGRELSSLTKKLCDHLAQFRKLYDRLHRKSVHQHSPEELEKHFLYVDEFVSNVINFYLTGFLEKLRNSSAEGLEEIDQEICLLVASEKKHREQKLKIVERQPEKGVAESEYILFRNGLVNKFVFDALHLSSVRSSLDRRFRTLVGGFAAAVAMLIFFVLFIWQGEVFLINSLPFVVITVLLYVLKDRIKEELRIISYREFHRWFPDYITKIQTLDGKQQIGKMEESFSFVEEEEVPEDILRGRSRELISVLETFKRREQIIYYKKRVIITETSQAFEEGSRGLNVIFRFNIRRFLYKADDPLHDYITMDSETHDLAHTQLPKVYHLNVILKNSFLRDNGTLESQLKKFRVILDKNGIRRVEQVRT